MVNNFNNYNIIQSKLIISFINNIRLHSTTAYNENWLYNMCNKISFPRKIMIYFKLFYKRLNILIRAI